MSAFIVNKEHIDALVSYMVSKQDSYWTGTERVYVTRCNADEVGRILLDENIRSVNYRYNKKYEEPPYRFSDFPRQLSPVQIIKAVHCLNYQCSETDDWETTLAHKILQEIILTACHNLPGYDAADWVIQAA